MILEEYWTAAACAFYTHFVFGTVKKPNEYQASLLAVFCDVVLAEGPLHNCSGTPLAAAGEKAQQIEGTRKAAPCCVKCFSSLSY